AQVELLDGDGDGEAAANQKRRDRGHEGPGESLAARAEGMLRVRGLTGTVEPNGEKDFVRRVGGGVRRLGQHAARAGNEPRYELRDRDDDVGKERDDDGAKAFALRLSPERGGRTPLGQDSQGQSDLLSYPGNSIHIRRAPSGS